VNASADERLSRAAGLREAGELEQARELLLTLRAEYPNDAQVAVQTAWVHDSLGLEEEAVEHYEAAIAGDLSDEELRGALLGLGSTYRTLGRDAESDRTFRLGSERFPEFRPLRAFHAMTAYNLGRPREAVEALLTLLLESTTDPTILRYQRSLSAYAEDLDRSWLDRPPPTAVSPQLSVRRGRDAVEFYKAAFGAVEIYRVGGSELHEEVVSQLAVGATSFWVADESPPHKNFSPESLGGSTTRLLLVVDDPSAVVERAVRLGATAVAPVSEEHGWLLGRIEDPFGHHWEIGKPLGEWPPPS